MLTPRSLPVTIKTLRKMASAGEPFAALTCYDATTARWLERAGVHILLVGDTAAEMVLGYSRTIDMPLDVLIALTAGVKRGAPSTVVMADMPFLSYHTSDEQALRNAGRFLTEGLADIVKIEADATFAPLVAKMTRAGIPVCAHVGTRPQQVALTGGYVATGKTPKQAAQIVADAVSLEQAGAVMLLVEAVPDSVAAEVLNATTTPVIGIGAGNATHGQVLVLQDLLGLTDNPPPFARAIAQLGPAIQSAAETYVQMVAGRRIGGRQSGTAKSTSAPSPPLPN